MSDFELTEEEKAQVIAQRISNLKASRYNEQLSLQLAEALPKDDESRAQLIAKAQLNIKSCEDLIKQLRGIELHDDNGTALNGNRKARRATGKSVVKSTKATRAIKAVQ